METVTTLKEEEKAKFESDYYEDQPLTDEQQTSSVCCGGGWSKGLVLIGVGAFLLFSNVTGFYLRNWWAVFILMPAFSSFSQALKSYRSHGKLDRYAQNKFTNGLMLTAVASFFLFGLSWGVWWPLFIIIVGIGSLLAGGSWR